MNYKPFYEPVYVSGEKFLHWFVGIILGMASTCVSIVFAIGLVKIIGYLSEYKYYIIISTIIFIFNTVSFVKLQKERDHWKYHIKQEIK